MTFHALSYLVRNVMPIRNNILTTRVLFSAAKGGVAKVAAPHTVPSLWIPKYLFGFHGTILLLSFTIFNLSESHTSLLVAYHN